MTRGTNGSAGRRLSPHARREQLLGLGVELLATHSLDELTIDVLAERAQVSRGLLYHYFGGKQSFREAVVRRAVADVVEQTAPPAGGEPLDRLLSSMTAYVDYVEANHAGYLSIVRGAAGGNETLRRLHEEARQALTDRIFTVDAQGTLVADTPANRLVLHGWSALAEDLVLGWLDHPGAMSRAALLDLLTATLPALVALTGDLDLTNPVGSGGLPRGE